MTFFFIQSQGYVRVHRTLRMYACGELLIGEGSELDGCYSPIVVTWCDMVACTTASTKHLICVSDSRAKPGARRRTQAACLSLPLRGPGRVVAHADFLTSTNETNYSSGTWLACEESRSTGYGCRLTRATNWPPPTQHLVPPPPPLLTSPLPFVVLLFLLAVLLLFRLQWIRGEADERGRRPGEQGQRKVSMFLLLWSCSWCPTAAGGTR